MHRTGTAAGASTARTRAEPPRRNRCIEFFMPSGVADPTLAQRYRDTIRIGIALTAICALYAVVQPIGGEFGHQLRVLFGIGVGMNLLCLWVGKRLGQLTIPIQFVLLYFAGLFSFSAYSLGGPTASSLYWLTGLPLIALLTGGRGWALTWGAVSLVIMGGFIGADELGYAFPDKGTPEQQARIWWISTTALIALTLGQAASYDRTRILALDMLRHANERLLDARQRVAASVNSRTSFLTNMSHELRTPMAAILGFTDVALEQLEEAPHGATDRGTLQTIQRHARNLLKTLDGVLDIAKIEEGRLPLRGNRVEIRELLEDLITQHQDTAKDQGTWITLEETPVLSESLFTDARRLRQILLNLLENAIPHCFEHELRVRVCKVERPTGSGFDFEITATGAELTQQQIAQLVRSPYRTEGPGTAESPYGKRTSGLGLVVSQLLADLLGGRIAVECRVGSGTLFRLEVPAEPPNSKQDPPGKQTAAPRSESNPVPAAHSTPASPSVAERTPTADRMTAAGHAAPAQHASAAAHASAIRRAPSAESESIMGCRVLVIDDGPDNLRLARHFLGRAGARVTCCESGPKGLDAIAAASASGRPFQVILLDIQMPEMDGHQVAALLKQQGCEIPIVAFTAHSLASERERCLRGGFDDYVTKPIDRAALVAVVAHHAQRGAEAKRAANSEDAAPTPQPLDLHQLWERCVRFCTPEGRKEDPAEVRRLHVLLCTAAVGLPVILIQAAIMYFIFPAEVARICILLQLSLLPVMLGLILTYRWIGSAQLVANALVGSIVGQILMLSLLSGGIVSPAGFWFALVPAISIALVRRRATLAWTALCLCLQAGLLLAAQAGTDFPNHLLPSMGAISHGLSAAVLCGQLLGVMLAHEGGASTAIKTLFAANRWLEQAREHSRRAEQSRAAFLGNLSHDLHAPLVSILGFASTLQSNWRRSKLPPERLEPLETIERNALRLRDVVDDLLEYSELDAGQVQAEHAPFSPARVLRQLLEEYAPRAASSGLWLNGEVTDAIPGLIYGDERRTQRTLVCLIENALKFTASGGVRISVGVRVQDGSSWLHFAVTDTGPGIPEEQVAELFEPFRQGDTSKSRKHSGSGLGLALTRHLVTTLRGRIEVCSAGASVGASATERGTQFGIWLPLTPVAGVAWVESLECSAPAATPAQASA